MDQGRVRVQTGEDRVDQSRWVFRLAVGHPESSE